MWKNKEDDRVVFVDKRREIISFLNREKERILEINPDIQADFTNLPFADKTFKLVVFDPPHLIKAGDNSWLVKKFC